MLKTLIHSVLLMFWTCHFGQVFVNSGTAASCGIRPKWTDQDNNKRITGGHEAKPGSWPWMTNIFITGLGEYFKCGAALISDRWVLTAAHCTIGNIGTMIVPASNYPEMLKVHVGVHNMDKPEGCEQEIAIKKVYLHPEWDIVSKNTSNGVKISSSHDIALLQLSKPVHFTSKVKSMCLDNGQKFDAGKICYIAGWGTQTLKGPPTRILHEAALPLVSHEQCNDPLSYSGAVSADMICAGYKQGGVDTCEGDSGGPLMCQGEGGRWFLTGVASFGHTGCGVPNKYGVYTRVVNHLRWISKVTGMTIPQPRQQDIPLITVGQQQFAWDR
ncbi:chymotrypsin-like elastase family member 2A [Acropora millepora]|uniref:chymotrypsin-like elastase family member 2A n=1 Tax=Acropora millepora TaxID=45264 RepID=UPI001CF402AE|nr:chymotrypsin-like elastase family member 2A [Acropora millepora]XP_044182707.1 chymotrypsin-like elastase family member 2A [Acropora millepora]